MPYIYKYIILFLAFNRPCSNLRQQLYPDYRIYIKQNFIYTLMSIISSTGIAKHLLNIYRVILYKNIFIDFYIYILISLYFYINLYSKID